MASWVLVASGLACGGCGLTLDYAPPQQRRIGPDVGRLDAARIDAALDDDGGLDASPSDLDASAQDAAVADATVDAATDDATIRTDAGHRSLGDCVTSSDCPGGSCIELVSGGYRVCRTPPVPATHCDGSRLDLCCSDGDCASGQECFLGPVHPICGGATRSPANECAADDCARDSDCPSGICAPAGVFAPVATCLGAICRHDDDCTDEVGGTCVLARDPCCSLPVALVCTYPSNGCRANADCGSSAHCDVVAGRAQCVPGPRVCPG